MEMDRHENEERWVERRAQYLRARYDLHDKSTGEMARSVYVALSELGYSDRGIAGHSLADSNERTTVRSHLEEIAETFGDEAAYACKPDQIGLETPMGAIEPE